MSLAMGVQPTPLPRTQQKSPALAGLFHDAKAQVYLAVFLATTFFAGAFLAVLVAVFFTAGAA